MLISHSMQLLPGNVRPEDWTRISAILLFTKAATPLFVFVFGMTMAFVYYERMLLPDGALFLRRRMWRRALLAFLSFEFLVIVVETANQTPFSSIIMRLLYLRPGNWAEVLNFYVVLLLVGPWVVRWWRRTPSWMRLLVVPSLYLLGTFLAQVPVPSELFVLKNIITSYPLSSRSEVVLDTFPVLQLSSFFLVGLSVGQHLFERLKVNRMRQVFVSLSLFVLVGGLASYFLSGDTVRDFLRDMALDHYRFPPQISYVLFGLASVLAITMYLVWIVNVRKSTNSVIRMIELLGRHSLFTFNLQYVLLFTVYGLLLGLQQRLSFLASLLNTCLVIVVCVTIVWIWERWRLRTVR